MATFVSRALGATAGVFALSLGMTATAHAEHWDVIVFEMTGKCTFQKYMTIVTDFNAWGKAYGYSAKIAAPLQSDNLTTYFWIGSSDTTAGFGAAWDAWRDAQSDAASVPAKLQARFEDCSTNMQRRAYDVY